MANATVTEKKYTITTWKYAYYGTGSTFEHCTQVNIMDISWVHFTDKDGLQVRTNAPCTIVEEKPEEKPA